MFLYLLRPGGNRALLIPHETVEPSRKLVVGCAFLFGLTPMPTIPLPKGLSATYSPTLVRWLLNLATHEEGAQWLGQDSLRFAAFFAVLRHRVTIPQAALAVVPPVENARGKVSQRAEELDAWKETKDRPIQGLVSPAFLEAFWEGTLVADWTQRHPNEWKEVLGEIAKTYEAETQGDFFSTTLAEHARTHADKPSLLAAVQPAVGRQPVCLFHLNVLLLEALLPYPLLTSEKQLLELGFLLAEDEGVRLFFEVVGSNPRLYRELLTIMLNEPKALLESSLGPDSILSKTNLLPLNRKTGQVMPLVGFWHEWLGSIHQDGKAALNRIVMPLKRKANSGALGRLPPSETEMLLRLLAPDNTKETKGSNVLVYGARSIDKLGWVMDQAEKIKRVAYTLPESIPEEARASACFFAQRIAASLPDPIVLVLPQAETILTRTQRGTHQFLFLTLEMADELPDSESEEQLLQDNPVPTVWMVHSPERISENNIGRFLYVCEVKAASRAERRVEIETELKDLNLSEGFINELSQHMQLSEKQLASAGEVVYRLCRKRLYDTSEDAQKEREGVVRQVLEQSQKALGRRQKEALRQSLTHYSLDFLNTSGAFNIDQIIKALKINPAHSLCFYGIPGTGKTQLAEHMAVELDKPLLIKRASDLMGKYVGENEKQIKAMFEEASDEDALLLLDEADSFLRDRNMARQGWEISMVNELLQGMERHRGTFVCTTNLFSHLDAASLRRFTFKLEFRALDPEQRWKMFLNESGLAADAFDAKEKERLYDELTLTQNLAPGDFATIQRQVRLLGETWTADQWIHALKAEASTKMREVLHTIQAPERY